MSLEGKGSCWELGWGRGRGCGLGVGKGAVCGGRDPRGQSDEGPQVLGPETELQRPAVSLEPGPGLPAFVSCPEGHLRIL